MPIVYLEQDYRFIFSYPALKKEYNRFVDMSDIDFLNNLASAAHLACYISYIKELPPEDTIGDKGIVHELIHLMDMDKLYDVRAIREQFKELLKLA